MQNRSKITLCSVLLLGWHISAYADTSDTSKTLPVAEPHPRIYELKPIPHTSDTETNSNTTGLKLGSKNKIELYGTVEIGYSKWSQKN